MKRFILLAALFGSLVVATGANAAINAYSYQSQSGFIFARTTGLGGDGVLGTDDDTTTQVDVTDLTSFASGQTATTNANVTSIPGTSTGSSLTDGDAPPAQEGIALADNFDFSNQVGTGADPYARGDTFDDGGSPISGTGNPDSTADLEFVADSELTNFTTDNSTANGFSQTDANFTLTLASAGFFWVEFTGIVDLLAELDVPSGTFAQTTTAFSVQITNQNTNANVFNWAPDGVDADGAAGAERDPFSMNTSRSRFAANGTGATPFTGGGGFGGAGSFFRNGVLLAANTPYLISIASQNDVRLSTFSNVPEPASVFVWGGIGILGLCGFYTRRRYKLS